MASDKFKAAVEHIIHKSHGGPSIGATRLNKTLFYSDLYAYLRDGQTITGERYIKLQNGPVPEAIWSTLNQLESGGHVLVRQQAVRFAPTEYIPIDSVPQFGSALSEDERYILDDMRARVMGYTATAISEFSHQAVWNCAAHKGWMPFSASLVDVAGDYSDATIAWAESEVKELEAVH